MRILLSLRYAHTAVIIVLSQALYYHTIHCNSAVKTVLLVATVSTVILILMVPLTSFDALKPFVGRAASLAGGNEGCIGQAA